MLQTARFISSCGFLKDPQFMKKTRHLLALLALMVAVAPARAELTRFEIEKRELVAEGQSFGDAGAYMTGEIVRLDGGQVLTGGMMIDPESLVV